MKYWICLAAILIASPAIARPEKVARVKDGDTFELARHRIFGTATSIRVLNIDTPEHDHMAKCEAERLHGIKAMEFAADLVSRAGGIVTLSRVKRDKYGGRFNARVTMKINGVAVDWAAAMTSAGLALPYTGQGAKPDWCEILKG